MEKDKFENLAEGLTPIVASDELNRRVRRLAGAGTRQKRVRWIVGGVATASVFGIALGLLPNVMTTTTVMKGDGERARAGTERARAGTSNSVASLSAPFTRSIGRPLGARSAEAAAMPAFKDSGKFMLRSTEGRILADCPLQHTDVHVNINGPIARVTVTQKFKGLPSSNNSATEALYTFPLPETAAVDDMTMKVGDNRTIKGQIKRREEAQAIYNTAKQNGQTASLLDQERDNIFTQSVANIQPNEDVTVTISYVTMLKYEDGVYEFVHPMVIGPRYEGNLTGLPATTNTINPSSYNTTRLGHDINLTVDLDAGMPLEAVQSELHDVQIQKVDNTHVKLELAPQDRIPNKDFILRYSAAGLQVQEGLMAHADISGKGGGYFTLMLQPPARPERSQITPKELVFVIDQTGSQSGAPIEKSKETMRYCLKNLRPTDTFQLVGFNTKIFPCFPKSVPATPENIAKANRFLDGIEAAGGTDILGAVKYALQMPDDSDRLRIISYMTDGYVGNDREILGFMHNNATRARMFPFGIGNSVNRFLIEGMAREGRGEAEIVDLNADSRAIAKKFYKRMADPLLTNISVNWNGMPVTETFPSRIPDVFSSTPIVIKGRYTKAGPGQVTVNGFLRGKPWSRTLAVNFPTQNATSSTQQGEGSDAIRVLWARTKLQEMQTNVYAGIATPDAVASVALGHHLMSEYTSFVAVDETTQSNRNSKTVAVPAAQPDGVAADIGRAKPDPVVSYYKMILIPRKAQQQRSITNHFGGRPSVSVYSRVTTGSSMATSSISVPLPTGAMAKDANPAPVPLSKSAPMPMPETKTANGVALMFKSDNDKRSSTDSEADTAKSLPVPAKSGSKLLDSSFGMRSQGAATAAPSRGETMSSPTRSTLSLWFIGGILGILSVIFVVFLGRKKQKIR